MEDERARLVAAAAEQNLPLYISGDEEDSSSSEEDGLMFEDDDDDDDDDDALLRVVPQHPPPVAANSIANGLLPSNDLTMLLTPAERSWALELKQSILHPNNDNNDQHDVLDPLSSDFEYAQWAIITQGDRASALRRIAKMQAFYKNYKVDNTIAQAVYYIKALMEQQPGFILNLNVDLARQESINAFDCGKFNPDVAMGFSARSNAESASSSSLYGGGGVRDHWQICMCAIYYLKYSCQPSFAVIRNGFLELIDFGDVEWHNFSLEAQERLFGEMLGDYPMLERHLLAYNTGYIANVGFGLAKKILPKSMLDSIQLGCRVIENDESRNPTKRLCEFYLQPNLGTAQLNLLERAKILMAMRQHNEAIFRL